MVEVVGGFGEVNDTRLLNIRTQDGYHLKLLFDFLQHALRTIPFYIDEDSIKSRSIDNHEISLIDVKLDSDNFRIFNCPTPMNFGINSQHLYKMVKSTKKKDGIALFIDSQKSDKLGISPDTSGDNKPSTNWVKIQTIQNLEIIFPEGYSRPVVATSSEFQKICKDMSNIGKIVTISAGKTWIKFECDAGEIMSSERIIGVCDDKEIYRHSFHTSNLTRLVKVVGISQNIKIYTKQDLPLLIVINIGTLGHMSVYTKSNEQLDDDKKSCDSD